MFFPLQDISIGVVFLQGLFSFFSPCILPLLPIYFTYLAGSSIEELQYEEAKKVLYKNALGFILGFFIIFVLLGAAATSIGQFLSNYTHRLWMERIGGLFILLFGLYHAKVISIKGWEREHRFQYVNRKPSFIGAIVMGMAFSFGWTPCTGPALGVALTLAAAESTLYKGIFLLVIYSLGLGIPFFLSAVFAGYILDKIQQWYKYFGLLSKIAGWLMVLLGVLMLSGNFDVLIRI